MTQESNRLHYLQHVEAEDLAYIETWAKERGFAVTATRLHLGETLPSIDTFDWLVVMGGPMNIYEEDQHPWLAPEKQFIRKAIDARKTIVGVCLGAQLIADVLGAKVTKNEHIEIGWFSARLTNAAEKLPMFNDIPESFTAFHWHGDRFDIPEGATHILESDACREQGFLYDNHVLALQCHLEETCKSIEHLLANFQHEMVPGEYVQSVAEVRGGVKAIRPMQQVLTHLLDALPNANQTAFTT